MVKVGVVGVCPKIWAFLNFVTRVHEESIDSPLSIYTSERFKVEVVGVLAEASEYRKLNLWGIDEEFPLVSEFDNLVDDLGADVIVVCASGIETIKGVLGNVLNRGVKFVIVDEPLDESVKRELGELKGKPSVLVGDLIGYLDAELFSSLIHNYLSFLLGNVNMSTLKFTSRRFLKRPSERKAEQSYVVIVPRNIAPDVSYTKSIITKKLGDRFLSVSIDAECSYVFSVGAKIFDLVLVVELLNNETASDDLVRDVETYAFHSVNVDFSQYFYSLRRIFEFVKQVISSGRKI